MHTIKLIKYALLIVLTSNFVSYGMSGDRRGTGPGIPRGPYVPSLPGIVADPQTDPAVARAIEKIAQSWRKKQENVEKRRKESLEQPAKRRRKGKEEDTGQRPQAREAEALSTTTATTTTTSTMATQSRGESAQERGWAEAELGDLQIVSPLIPRTRESSQASILDEAEWSAILRGIDQTTAREYAEEWFREFLPQVEDTLFRRDPNLINFIGERFFEREITPDELNPNITRSPYIIRLRVRARSGQRITREQIKLISQKFPNLRELHLKNINLKDAELETLSKEPIASQLTLLDISNNKGMTITRLGNALQAFIRLLALDVSYIGLPGDKVLEMLAQQPFAGQLTHLNFNGFLELTEDDIEHMNAFVSLTHLELAEDYLDSDALYQLARLPFAPHLIALDLNCGDLNWGELEDVIHCFISLRILKVKNCDFLNDNDLASLAAQSFASQLTELNLEGSNITGQGIAAHMNAFIHLRSLNIARSDIENEGLMVLAEQPFAHQLTALNIQDCEITSQEALSSMAGFINLRELDIAGNNIGDEGLRLLSELPFASNLTVLNLSRTGVTEEGWERYKNAFSSLKEVHINF